LRATPCWPSGARQLTHLGLGGWVFLLRVSTRREIPLTGYVERQGQQRGGINGSGDTGRFGRQPQLCRDSIARLGIWSHLLLLGLLLGRHAARRSNRCCECRRLYNGLWCRRCLDEAWTVTRPFAFFCRVDLNCLAERRRLDCWTHEITRRQTTTKKKNNVGAAQVSRWFVPDCAPAMVMRLHASGHRRLTPSTCCFDAAECSPSSLSDEDPWSAMTRKQNDEADLVTATVKGNVA